MKHGLSKDALHYTSAFTALPKTIYEQSYGYCLKQKDD